MSFTPTQKNLIPKNFKSIFFYLSASVPVYPQYICIYPSYGLHIHDLRETYFNCANGLIPTLNRHILTTHHDKRIIGIKNCGIEHIEDDTFKGMSTLEQLDLSCNKLKTLGRHSLCGALSLKTLRLNNNDISTIHQGASALRSLKEVNLNDNKLMAIPAKLFVGLNFEILWVGWNPAV